MSCPISSLPDAKRISSPLRPISSLAQLPNLVANPFDVSDAHHKAPIRPDSDPRDHLPSIRDSTIESPHQIAEPSNFRCILSDPASSSITTPNALFSDEKIETWRVIDGDIPDLVRVIVAVDPSGSGDDSGTEADAIGIVVAGLGTDGVAYVLEDLTVKAGPAVWGKVAVDAYIRHEADAVVGEANYGGAMVQHVIRTAAAQRNARVNYRKVTATRGKVVRAEPISALYEDGKVRHVGYLRDLEDELSGFTTNGYVGDRSPNRADALVWAITELFPAIVAPQKSQIITSSLILPSANFWNSRG